MRFKAFSNQMSTNTRPTVDLPDKCLKQVDDSEEVETIYVEQENEFIESGDLVETLEDEHKGLLWQLLKQVRPGMDLSKVVLPTFILEPRSFLDKLSDSYFHADILTGAVTEDDAFTRMKLVTKFYLSGFYKKPRGLKKPYNPILGETFRCYWQHPNGSRTFYIAEQVSHHPPVSAFYVSNRQDGFTISCDILAKSKFYGNTTSAVLEGQALLTLLPRGEVYRMNSPYAHCKGILLGTLSMEFGGNVEIACDSTGYNTHIEFKLKPFIGGQDTINTIAGKIKLGKETVAKLNGKWDDDMFIKIGNQPEQLLFSAKTGKSERLKRFLVPLECQLLTESERLWQKVSIAIRNEDQQAATEEKAILEERQRQDAKERKVSAQEWQPLHFEQDEDSNWNYKFSDQRPWDPRNDVREYEARFQILTKTLKPIAPVRSRLSTNPLSQREFSVSPKARDGTVASSNTNEAAQQHGPSTLSQTTDGFAADEVGVRQTKPATVDLTNQNCAPEGSFRSLRSTLVDEAQKSSSKYLKKTTKAIKKLSAEIQELKDKLNEHQRQVSLMQSRYVPNVVYVQSPASRDTGVQSTNREVSLPITTQPLQESLERYWRQLSEYLGWPLFIKVIVCALGLTLLAFMIKSLLLL